MALKPACRTSVKSRLKYVWFVSCRILQKYSWELRFLNLSMFSQKPIFFFVRSFRKRFSGFLVWLWKLISNFLTFNMIFIFSSIPAVWSVIYGQTLLRNESIKQNASHSTVQANGCSPLGQRRKQNKTFHPFSDSCCFLEKESIFFFFLWKAANILGPTRL